MDEMRMHLAFVLTITVAAALSFNDYELVRHPILGQ